MKEERSSTSGLKRTLSEGSEKDGQTVKIEGKRPKMEREELEAQLELKITTKAGSHHKLGKVCIRVFRYAFTLVAFKHWLHKIHSHIQHN